MDKQAIACNYAVDTRACSLNSVCYVIDHGPGLGGERMQILAHSRGGRWIVKWEASWRLHNFRFKKVPETNPIYDRIADFSSWDQTNVQGLNSARDRERGEKLAQLAGMTKASAHT